MEAIWNETLSIDAASMFFSLQVKFLSLSLILSEAP